MFPLVLEIFIDQSTVLHEPLCKKKFTSWETKACNSVSWNTWKHTLGFPCPSAQERAPQIAGTDSPFQISVFLYGIPKAGRKLECPPCLAGQGKAVFRQGTQHFCHLGQKRRGELSGCREITAPERDWKRNGKGLAPSESLVGWGRGRRWRLLYFFLFFLS